MPIISGIAITYDANFDNIEGTPVVIDTVKITNKGSKNIHGTSKFTN
jgi:hypothetical protein